MYTIVIYIGCISLYAHTGNLYCPISSQLALMLRAGVKEYIDADVSFN